ncbi:chlorophyllase [Planosporangium flavigriseum]|uniref:PET hydrolase/cutinase-like domain-containing protein n=1 Tax=Planosporangium flavigriseum TaxID=373681 RepID=A0A8J3PN05_9ACTN|nr:alpha/beta hydrolase [Planosporangium flavigriseum]NJC66702.1 chlorophyllase [Planosporangium flavigriseum]GIG74854.1 hypothetical protein Pfl04_32580 [Planosporangium flavigriseum]
MHRRLLRGLLALVLAGLLTSCVATPRASPAASTAPSPSHSTAAAAPQAVAPQQRAPLPSRLAPSRPLAVGVRELNLARGADRPLPTTVWYPAKGAAGGDVTSDAAAAAGRFPLIVLSHGLNGRPEALAPVAIRWAAAGFVVAAPAYPHTKYGAPRFDIADVVNQPADASYVISELLALDGHDGDRLAGHIDTAAVAATGHSAGGITTTAMLSAQRDPRLRAAVVIAGALLGGAYNGPVTPVLFVHGDADPTVSYQGGQSAYQAVPWPKAFLTLVGAGHGSYLTANSAGFDQTINTTTDFLRWSLYGDSAAFGRLNGDATSAGAARWESSL